MHRRVLFGILSGSILFPVTPALAQPPAPVLDVLEADESPQAGVARVARQLRDEMERAPGALPEMSPVALDERPALAELPSGADFDSAPPADEADRRPDVGNGRNDRAHEDRDRRHAERDREHKERDDDKRERDRERGGRERRGD